MTTKQFVSLETNLLREFSSLAIKGPLMFIPPVKDILRGIYFEGSSFDKTSFYVTVFVLPLCVPTKHLYFNFGNRIRHKEGGDRWSMEMPDLVSDLSAELKLQGLPFLSRTNSLLDFVEVAKSFSGNPHTLKAIALALAKEGRFEQSIKAIDELVPQLDLRVHWQLEISEQVKALRNKIVTNSAEAKQQLLDWETETIHNLKLGGESTGYEHS